MEFQRYLVYKQRYNYFRFVGEISLMIGGATKQCYILKNDTYIPVSDAKNRMKKFASVLEILTLYFKGVQRTPVGRLRNFFLYQFFFHLLLFPKIILSHHLVLPTKLEDV